MKKEKINGYIITPDKGMALRIHTSGTTIAYSFDKYYNFMDGILEIEEVPISSVPKEEINKWLDFKKMKAELMKKNRRFTSYEK